MSSSEAAARATGPIQSEEGAARPALRQLVVCSLKAWDEVWNRNNFLTDALLRRNPDLRVLFVEPPVDPLFELSERRLPTPPRLRTITSDGRLRVLRPIKPLPRRIGPLSDALLRIQVRAAARQFRLSRPVLWINDVTYAPLIDETSWRSVYDVSDDWLLAPFATREIQRLRDLDELALAAADQVVVCSQALARTRGAVRSVWLVPNAVDVAHFRNPRPRPGDLPSAPVALYAGTAHDARIDVDLVAELADRLPRVSIVFVGPNAFSRSSQQLAVTTPTLTPRSSYDLRLVVSRTLYDAGVAVATRRRWPRWPRAGASTSTRSTSTGSARTTGTALKVSSGERLAGAGRSRPIPAWPAARRGCRFNQPCSTAGALLDCTAPVVDLRLENLA